MPSSIPFHQRELRVGDAVFLFQFSKKRRCRLCPAILRKSGVQHDFRLNVNSDIEPCCLFFAELNLFPIDCDTIWLGREVLLVVLGVGLKPVLNGCSGSADAEPLAEITTFGQRSCCGMRSARQAGMLVRSGSKNGRSGELVTSTWSSPSRVTITSKNSVQFNLNLAVPRRQRRQILDLFVVNASNTIR
jgi:hypothetical protein